MSEYKYKPQAILLINISIKEHWKLPALITMNSVATKPVEALSKGTYYSRTNYDEGFAIYSISESFMFGFLKEFPEASHTHSLQWGLYTDENSPMTFINNNENQSCNTKQEQHSVLGKNSSNIKYTKDYIVENKVDTVTPTQSEYKGFVKVPLCNIGIQSVAHEGVTEAPTHSEFKEFVKISLSDIGVCSVAEEGIMEAITQYEYEDYIELSLSQTGPQ